MDSAEPAWSAGRIEPRLQSHDAARAESVGARAPLLPFPAIHMALVTRLALLTGLLTLALLLAANEVLLRLSERSRLDDLRVETEALADTWQALLSRAAPTGDSLALDAALERWPRRHITLTSATVFVAGPGGMRMVGTAGALGAAPWEERDALALRRRDAMMWQSSSPASAWHVVMPLGGGGVPYGVLHVMVSTEQLTAWAQQERRRAYLIALVTAVLVAVGVGLLTSRWVGRPLSAIGEAMSQAHRGATGAPHAPEAGAEEFRSLARRYNELRDALAMREMESAARGSLLALEERARGLERMALLEEAAAGFAHEIGTPLGTVRGHLQMLDDDVANGSREGAGQRIQLLLAQVDRVADIVRARLHHGAWPAPRLQSVPLVAVAERILSFLAPSLDQAGVTAGVREPGTDTGALALCDPKLVEQILLNLIKNAIEALPPGGRIELVAGAAPDHVWLDVADDGPGLTAETQRQLFNPFVTTKGPDGTGLGLPVSRRIARSLGGDLTHLDTPRGTTWRLTLPRAEAA